MLKNSFKPAHDLSPEFEERVMSSVNQEHQRSLSSRKVLFIMMAYWVIASLVSAWIWFQSYSSAPVENLSQIVLLSVLALIMAGLYMVVHQAKMRLSDLFLGTLR
jgi:cytoskeletal protein RodZ